MNLNEKQRKYLRGLAHDLKPTVFVGMSGASESVLQEIQQCLAHHELIKVKLRLGSREARDDAIQTLVAASGAELIKRRRIYSRGGRRAEARDGRLGQKREPAVGLR